jgi:hypothetical protein
MEMKRLIIVAAAVAVLALAAVAVGGAATSADEGDGPIGTFLSKVADKLGVTEDELKTAIDETRAEMIDEAVAEGRLTEQQRERLREHAEEGGILFPPPLRHGGLHQGPGPGPGPGLIADAAAQVLGMEKEELIEARQDGQSLAEIAEAQMGEEFDLEAFKTALLDEIQAQLNGQVEDIFQHIEENIDDIVNVEGCPGGFGEPRWGPGGFRGPGFGPFGDVPEATEPSEVTA